MIDPTYEGGYLFAVGPHGLHAAPVVQVDHDTLRYEFKTQWLYEGPIDQYCWSFLTPVDNERSYDAMPDSVGTGSVSGTQGGYRHILRETDTSCRP
jgi:hypothetical protein